ncbi:MAG: 2-hydroxychromene-2-carboxylate isomerase [Pseudomonadota bacterium]
MATVDFWFEYTSTYSHLAALRARGAARAAGVALHWRVFLLGPIFGAQGLTDSPFNLFPAKGANMWRDMERQAAKHGLPSIVRPDPFPQNGLLASRCTTALPEAKRPAFAEAVFRAEFAEGRTISDPRVVAELLAGLGEDAEAVMGAARSAEVKAALRAETEAAQALGIFGAPTFVTEDGELFWGHDRMEDAFAWAAGRAVRP